MKKGNFKSQVTRQKKINQGIFFLFFSFAAVICFSSKIFARISQFSSVLLAALVCFSSRLLCPRYSYLFFLLIFSLTQIFSLSSGKSETNALAGRSSHYALACCSGKILLLAVFNLHHILNCA